MTICGLNSKGSALLTPSARGPSSAKAAVCQAIGYPIPATFRKSQPRFPGQDVDVYVQKADNLQIWNEEIAPSRRYVLIRLDEQDVVVDVRVVTGEVLVRFDRTAPYAEASSEAPCAGRTGSALVSPRDTESFIDLFQPVDTLPASRLALQVPTAAPVAGASSPSLALYARSAELVGHEITDPGHGQERIRGAALHRLACQALGLGSYADHGQVPDIRCQVLEVKLQVSATIDLGLVAPDSEAPAQGVHPGARYCDMRYAVAYARACSQEELVIAEIIVVTGQAFLEEFQRFEGRILNKKLQMRLPAGFFSDAEGLPHQTVHPLGVVPRPPVACLKSQRPQQVAHPRHDEEPPGCCPSSAAGSA